MIRVVLPAHLRTLARVDGEVTLDVEGPVTQRSVLDALEARYPMLRGTIRDHVTQQRRPFVRFFACEEDLSHEPPDAPLPDAVATGAEPFLVVGRDGRRLGERTAGDRRGIVPERGSAACTTSWPATSSAARCPVSSRWSAGGARCTSTRSARRRSAAATRCGATRSSASPR